MTAVSDPAVSHYDAIGGAPAVRSVVDAFYDRVLADDELAPFFASRNIAEIKRHQVALFCQVLGGPKAYTGRDLADAHAGLGIQSRHFARTAAHLELVLYQAGVPAEVVNDVMATVGALESAIVAPPQ